MKKLNVILVYNEDKTKILMCKREKNPYKGLFNLVGGKLEEGETEIEGAYRELEEETGLVAEGVELLHSIYPTPAYTDEIIYIYIAKNVKSGKVHLDSDEFLNVEKIPTQKAKQMLLSGEIHDAKTIIALYSYFFR